MGDIAVSAGIFLAFVGGLVIVGSVVRQWTRKADDTPQASWSLRELTELRDSGQLTIQQYEKLAQRAVDEHKRDRTGR